MNIYNCTVCWAQRTKPGVTEKSHFRLHSVIVAAEDEETARIHVENGAKNESADFDESQDQLWVIVQNIDVKRLMQLFIDKGIVSCSLSDEKPAESDEILFADFIE